MNTAFNELRDEVMSMGTSRWAIAFGIAIVAGLAVTQVASAGIDGEQEVVCRYVLRYAWFEPAPVRHSEIFDPVVAQATARARSTKCRRDRIQLPAGAPDQFRICLGNTARRAGNAAWRDV